jgi:hypothetical protein
VLWIPGPLPSLNELIAAAKGKGGRGYDYARLKRGWTDSIALLARAARLPRMERVFIRFTWRERDKRRNPDNVAAGGRKMVLDGLVTAGVLGNDGWGEVAGWSDAFEVSQGPGVLVTFEPVSAAVAPAA